MWSLNKDGEWEELQAVTEPSMKSGGVILKQQAQKRVGEKWKSEVYRTLDKLFRKIRKNKPETWNR